MNRVLFESTNLVLKAFKLMSRDAQATWVRVVSTWGTISV